jgi:Protein of unknown function (DUF4238)
MAQRPPRNHHLLAKLYQRGFANENNQAGLLVRETGEWDAPRNIRRLFRQRDFNAFVDVDGVRRQDFEELLAREVDGPAGEGFKALRAGDFPLPPEQREDVGRFIAAQVTRGRHVRELATRFLADLDRHATRLRLAHAGPDYWGARLGYVPSEEERQAWAEEAATPVDTTVEDVLAAQVGPVEVVTEYILRRIWTLVSFQRPCLFTSDEPVTMVSGTRAAAVGTADDIALPVSTTKALVLSWPDSGLDETVLQGGEDFAARLNERTLWWPPVRGLLVSLDVQSHPLPDDLPVRNYAPETVTRLRGT